MDDLALAHLLADAADAVTAPAFRSGAPMVTVKADGSVVTESDWEVERRLRALLAEHRPADAVHGEEEGPTGGGRRTWLIDPIDGTSSFVSGQPEWSTLIGLEIGGEVTVGVVSSPALGRRWWAVRGGGAWARTESGDDRRLRVSPVATLELARVAVWPPRRRLSTDWEATVLAVLAGAEAAGADIRGVDIKPSRGTGFPAAPVMVAAGALDGFVMLGAGAWDMAAVAVLVEEAGGRFSDGDGGRRLDAGSAVFSNGLIHETVLGWLP